MRWRASVVHPVAWLALAGPVAGAESDAQVSRFLALGKRPAPQAKPAYDLGTMFDTDLGLFTVSAIPTAFAGPRVIIGIERHCSCVGVTATCPSTGGALVPPQATVMVSGSIQLSPLPGRYQSDLKVLFAESPDGGSGRESITVPFTYNVRASFSLQPDLPSVLLLDRGEPCRWETRLQTHRPVSKLAVRGSGVAGCLVGLQDDRLGIAGPALELGEYDLRIDVILDGKTLSRHLRIVCKHPLLAASSVPAGLVSRNGGEVRIPLADPAADPPAISVPPDSQLALLRGLRLSREDKALTIAFTSQAPPGPFRDAIVLDIAGESVPVQVFGVSE